MDRYEMTLRKTDFERWYCFVLCGKYTLLEKYTQVFRGKLLDIQFIFQSFSFLLVVVMEFQLWKWLWGTKVASGNGNVCFLFWLLVSWACSLHKTSVSHTFCAVFRIQYTSIKKSKASQACWCKREVSAAQEAVVERCLWNPTPQALHFNYTEVVQPVDKSLDSAIRLLRFKTTLDLRQLNFSVP
jgi:hypothetical protein